MWSEGEQQLFDVVQCFISDIFATGELQGCDEGCRTNPAFLMRRIVCFLRM